MKTSIEIKIHDVLPQLSQANEASLGVNGSLSYRRSDTIVKAAGNMFVIRLLQGKWPCRRRMSKDDSCRNRVREQNNGKCKQSTVVPS